MHASVNIPVLNCLVLSLIPAVCLSFAPQCYGHTYPDSRLEKPRKDDSIHGTTSRGEIVLDHRDQFAAISKLGATGNPFPR
jgi:hypothetical protein